MLSGRLQCVRILPEGDSGNTPGFHTLKGKRWVTDERDEAVRDEKGPTACHDVKLPVVDQYAH